ncbi:MAG: hypothetical protein HY097_04625 [Nitrospinae bacterium]|nr:hypothetical protein [Nitrospinota bacterium]MBI3815728.1 hypothetical protein [Nitrospinota bacterium]
MQIALYNCKMMNFLRSEVLDVNGNAYEAKYYQNVGHNGEINYSVEVSIDGDDRIILDDMVLERLEWRLRKILYYAVFSRKLAKTLTPPLPSGERAYTEPCHPELVSGSFSGIGMRG